MADKKRGLGRGLSALMADVNREEPAAAETPRRAEHVLPIERVQPNPDQPRRRFNDEKLKELSASIREKGIIQPLIVRPDPKKDGHYQSRDGKSRSQHSFQGEEDH